MFGKNDGLVDMAFWTDDYINILAPLIEKNPQKHQNSFHFLTAMGD